ncbi:MAG: sugar phosphate isomerase/epimerase family protein [Candidatus Bathyarchaeota archaeon]|jgi:sugar phosphate isomerase/epimerase|nr:sugar phosphate isomerase/epimerase family protein [Candidatus Bathyarchaeota archaeon]
MEIAVSTLFCLNKPLEEVMPLILGAPTKFIELMDTGPHALSRSRVEAILEIKEAHGLEYAVHSPYTDVNIGANDPYVRETILERLESSIKYASDLGADRWIFHPGNTTALEWALPKGTAWSINIESVRRLVEYAKTLGVRAMIENLPEPFPFLMKSVEEFRRFYNQVGFKPPMVLDIAHAHIRGEELEFIRRFGDRIAHVHASDNQGDRDTHLRIGDGTVDWGKVMEALRESHFDGWVTIESHNAISESIRLLEDLK